MKNVCRKGNKDIAHLQQFKYKVDAKLSYQRYVERDIKHNPNRFWKVINNMKGTFNVSSNMEYGMGDS